MHFPHSSVGKESACSAGDPGSISGSGRSAGEVARLLTPVFLGFSCGSAGRRSPGEGKGYPLQYSGLENYMDCIVHGVAKSWTRPNDLRFHFH